MMDHRDAMQAGAEALEKARATFAALLGDSEGIGSRTSIDDDLMPDVLARVKELESALSLLRTALEAREPAIPEGFRLLPVEATDSMMNADWDVTMSEAHSNGGVSAAAWRAMVDAAPQVTYGNGHSGAGWYMHDTEYPEEGAVFLGAASPVAAPVEAREPFAWYTKSGFYGHYDEIPASDLPPLGNPVPLYASPVAADTQGDALAAKLANGYTSGLFTSDFQGHKISLRYETRGAGEAAHAALCAAIRRCRHEGAALR